jgi:hypothetical protein
VSRPRLERAAEAPPVVLVVQALVASAIVGVRLALLIEAASSRNTRTALRGGTLVWRRVCRR